ncbi:hypothetical protein PIB30_016093 [Stylosanthes scabra]|uniref:Uncharacterized protein n=1 Tax=Stylosanthes scabra TaxID=79078 RepID=A0ABU6Q719_9FABA|nr:hypothetical protein [Stylosanthes scabra]
MPSPNADHELMRRLTSRARRLLRVKPKYGSLTVECRGPSPKRPMFQAQNMYHNCTPVSQIAGVAGLAFGLHDLVELTGLTLTQVR